jgi:glycosyltransferase involved in cell wall biosynthesis
MRVTATLGPGHHGEELLAALRANQIEYRAISQSPDFAVEDWPGARLVHPWYRRFRHALWGSWRRLPIVGKSEAPRALDYLVYEAAAARQLQLCDVLIGWTQVSLRSLEKANYLGIPTLLEYPMTHIAEWRRIMAEEYRRWGGRGFYSEFPALMVARMNAEVAAADYVSVLSSFARRTFISAGVRPERVLELPLAVDPELFSPANVSKENIRVLCVGRLELLKGIPYLLQAVPDATLVGSVYDEVRPYLRDAAVLPPLPRAELPALYRRAEVVVFPSVNDAFGLVILEAMACGVPVVATDRSGAPDIIDDGVDGFVVPARDSAAIRERVERLRDPRLRKRMGEAARAKILARYTPAHYAARVGAVLSQIRGKARHG